MHTLSRSIDAGDWDGCVLALVAALDALPDTRALTVATELVDHLASKLGWLEPGRGRGQFIERARDSLLLAEHADGAERIIALASAVTDAVGALIMPDRDQLEARDLRGVQEAMGDVRVRPDRRSVVAMKQADAWRLIESDLLSVEELRSTVGRGIFEAGRSHDFAVKALAAGIL